MSKFITRNNLSSLLGSITLFGLSIQALALPSLPPGVEPRPPYHTLKNEGLAKHGNLSPALIRQAYGLPANYLGAGMTIALVENADAPNIEADLNTFSTQFGLPACTVANGCLTILYSAGSKPAPDANWAVETSLDVEWAHAIAPAAKIMLVEAPDPSSLLDAVQFAINQKPSVISMSWGIPEFAGETSFDPVLGNSTIPLVAATGDAGNGVWYPAASPYVLAVGGTQLTTDANGNYVSEVAWSSSSGGLSAYENEPAFQTAYVIPQATGKRGIPDVSWAAAGNLPYSVYDSYQKSGWMSIWGTSAATPQWAALIAVMQSAKQGHFASFNTSIYSVARQTNPVLLNDPSSGMNGSCGYICQARSGYDYVTGLGSPQASLLVNRFK
jgi:subtilase family serine protease